LPALDVSMGLTTPHELRRSSVDPVSEPKSLRSLASPLRVLRKISWLREGSRSPQDKASSAPSFLGEPLNVCVTQLAVHLSPGAIASRRLGKEQKHVKEERRRVRERNDSLVSIWDLTTSGRSPGGLRFKGMRASVRCSLAAAESSSCSARPSTASASPAVRWSMPGQLQITVGDSSRASGAAIPVPSPVQSCGKPSPSTPHSVCAATPGTGGVPSAFNNATRSPCADDGMVTTPRSPTARFSAEMRRLGDFGRALASCRTSRAEQPTWGAGYAMDEDDGEEGEEEDDEEETEGEQEQEQQDVDAGGGEGGVTVQETPAAAPEVHAEPATGATPLGGSSVSFVEIPNEDSTVCAARGSVESECTVGSKYRPSKASRSSGGHRARWWAPKPGDRVTAGLFGATFPQDSFTATPTQAAAAAAADDTKDASAKPGLLARFTAAGVRRASLVLHSAQPKGGGLAGSVLTPRSAQDHGAESCGAVAISHECGLPNDAQGLALPGTPPVFRAQSGALLDETLHQMEEAWGEELLTAHFAEKICVASQLRSLPVLRQQPLALVIQTRSTTASCRLDLCALPPITSSNQPSEMLFEVPLVRHGIVVGVATGLLTVMAGAPAAAASSSTPEHVGTRSTSQRKART